jgi:AraC-like DNA-binding protein
MSTTPQEIYLDGSTELIHPWVAKCSQLFNLSCELIGKSKFDSIGITKLWGLGDLTIVNCQLSRMTLTSEKDVEPSSTYLKVVVSGSMLVEQNGYTRTLNAGEMILINPCKPHRQTIIEQCHFVALDLPDKSLNDCGVRLRIKDHFLPNVKLPDIRAVAATICNIAVQNGSTSDSFRRRQGFQLVELLDFIVTNPDSLARTRSAATTLHRAKRFIAQNLRKPDLSPSLIASATCVSEAYLNRLFKIEQGQSLMRYVLACRLAAAVKMLRQSGEGAVRVSEVAYMCGFTSHAHFSRVFKDRYGVTPKSAVDNCFVDVMQDTL